MIVLVNIQGFIQIDSPAINYKIKKQFMNTGSYIQAHPESSTVSSVYTDINMVQICNINRMSAQNVLQVVF